MAGKLQDLPAQIELQHKPPILKLNLAEQLGPVVLLRRQILIRFPANLEKLFKPLRPDQLTLAVESLGVLLEQSPRLLVVIAAAVAILERHREAKRAALGRRAADGDGAILHRLAVDGAGSALDGGT